MVPVYKFALRADLKDEIEFLPKRAHSTDTGYDVRAAFNDRQPLTINPGEYFKIPLGFRVIPEPGWWFQLHPRSSSFVKKSMHNLIGIIDEHYSHEVLFAGQYLPNKSDTDQPLIIKYGEAIGQIVPIKRVDMEIVSISNEEYDDLCKQRMATRSGGIGSTG